MVPWPIKPTNAPQRTINERGASDSDSDIEVAPAVLADGEMASDENGSEVDADVEMTTDGEPAGERRVRR